VTNIYFLFKNEQNNTGDDTENLFDEIFGINIITMTTDDHYQETPNILCPYLSKKTHDKGL